MTNLPSFADRLYLKQLHDYWMTHLTFGLSASSFIASGNAFQHTATPFSLTPPPSPPSFNNRVHNFVQRTQSVRVVTPTNLCKSLSGMVRSMALYIQLTLAIIAVQWFRKQIKTSMSSGCMFSQETPNSPCMAKILGKKSTASLVNATFVFSLSILSTDGVQQSISSTNNALRSILSTNNAHRSILSTENEFY